AAGSENLAAAGGGQARAETVAALAHQFAGLIGPLHGSISADIAIRRLRQSAVELRRSGDAGRPKRPFAAPMSRPPKSSGHRGQLRGLYGRDPISSTLPDASAPVLRNGTFPVNITDSAVF